MTKQDLKKIDGNSLDEIARFLGVHFDDETYKEFDRLRRYSDYKVISIMESDLIWASKICNSSSEAIEFAKSSNLDPRSRKHNERVVFCAYDKEGNYIGGLESL